MTASTDFRVEKDSMGEMKIPNHFLYGASTQRAVDNFPVSELRFSRDFIYALGILKACCAETNVELKKLNPQMGKAIADVSLEISAGAHDEHFVVDIFQTGSGTSTNMNFNEVAATLATRKLNGERVHPNDHVNMGQSSNDIIPTAIHIVAAYQIQKKLLPALKAMESALNAKAKSFAAIIKTGRTHLQDATPISLGQEFSGYAAQISQSLRRVESVLPALCELAIGGTAVGTGINTHQLFAQKTCEKVAKKMGLPFIEAKNHFEAQAAKDACVEASGQLKALAVSLTKIANDIRWLGCGPRAGIGEIKLPEVQPGSSIMPGKVNPVIAESLLMVCAQVIGNDATITLGGLSGNFELNVMMPVISYNLSQSIELLASGCKMFTEKCIQGLEADEVRIRDVIEKGLMLATALAPKIGYDKAAAIAKQAYKEHKTIREVCTALGVLSAQDLDHLLDPRSMVKPQE